MTGLTDFRADQLKGRKCEFLDIANVNIVGRARQITGRTDHNVRVSSEGKQITGLTNFRADRLKGSKYISSYIYIANVNSVQLAEKPYLKAGQITTYVSCSSEGRQIAGLADFREDRLKGRKYKFEDIAKVNIVG